MLPQGPQDTSLIISFVAGADSEVRGLAGSLPNKGLCNKAWPEWWDGQGQKCGLWLTPADAKTHCKPDYSSHESS